MAELQAAKGAPDAPIGIAMSGGGYRASAYHLGTLSYLNDLHEDGLLPGIGMLSTVSGGTFTGVKYTLSLAQKKPFSAFLTEFYDYLEDSNLVKEALARLGRNDTGSARKRCDVIVALAEIYSSTFLADEDHKPYRFGTILDADDIPVTAAVFNATEFRHGIAFRFQRSANAKAKIGNYYLNIPADEAAKIRLGDIVAASSCFPGGFEPLAFPDDFDWPDDTVPHVIRQRFPKPVPLMDGGVYDNQGIESLLYADAGDAETLSMFIISDVDVQKENIYSMPDDPSVGVLGNLSLGAVGTLSWVGMILCAITAIVVGTQWWLSGRHDLPSTVAHVMAILLAAGTAGLIWYGRRVVRRFLKDVPKTDGAAWADLKQLKLNHVASMLNLRITSLLALAMSVFMHRIRQLGFGLVYGDETYEDRRVSNLIYSLTKTWKLPELVPSPSGLLDDVVVASNKMPTALWFPNDYSLPSLVACGQATICYNLMKFVDRQRRPAQPPDVMPTSEAGAAPAKFTDDHLERLWVRLTADWDEFNADPYARLKRQLPAGTKLPLPPKTK